jgi:hypothetical protein
MHTGLFTNWRTGSRILGIHGYLEYPMAAAHDQDQQVQHEGVDESKHSHYWILSDGDVRQTMLRNNITN